MAFRGFRIPFRCFVAVSWFVSLRACHDYFKQHRSTYSLSPDAPTPIDTRPLMVAPGATDKIWASTSP